MAGLYLHIPFCKRKCVYCDFFSTAQYDTYGASYIDAALREMEAARDYLAGEPMATVYLGGGTPSLYPASDIARLLDGARELFGGGAITETTLEANPEDITPQYLQELKTAGIDRLSLGIQSFDDDLLAFMKRRHDSARAAASVALAREAGFGNIGIDLIYGIPGLTLPLWEATLRQAISMAPEHISAYHLTFEPGTTLGRWLAAGKAAEIAEEESHRQYDLLHRLLTDAGYEHYEVSNFARPGCRSRHNSSYWTGEKYLGIGPGAHSYNGRTRRWCAMTLPEYVDAPQILYESETLTPDDIYNELIMTSLRCTDGITTGQIAARAGRNYAQYFQSAADPLLASGLLSMVNSRYVIPPSRFLTSDNIIAKLFI
ncbi:MAG: radical SAM family heme chaperone HemW [Alistipes sp.]|nr:radical SAM family heme chaperone HemW [Alistipes sp.]